MGALDGADRTVLAARVSVPEHVVHREFGQEAVALNLRTGGYHGLNPTATRMLEALEQVDFVGEATSTLASELGVPCAVIERDLSALCRSLAERGLIVLDHPDGG